MIEFVNVPEPDPARGHVFEVTDGPRLLLRLGFVCTSLMLRKYAVWLDPRDIHPADLPGLRTTFREATQGMRLFCNTDNLRNERFARIFGFTPTHREKHLTILERT